MAAACRAVCIGELTNYEKKSNDTTVLTYANAKVTLRAWDDSMVEVSVETAGRNNADVECQPPAGETDRLKPSDMKFIPELSFARVGKFSSSDMPDLYKPGMPFRLSFGTEEKPISQLELEGICWDATGTVTFTFKNSDKDHFYGLGEPRTPDAGLLSLDYQGRTREVWNKHWAPADVPVNYFYNPRGYGLFFDNYSHGKFDFTAKDKFTYQTDGGRIRFFVIAGKTPADSLSAYMKLTGLPPMPPLWTLGYMQSRYGYHDEAEFTSVMDGLRSRKIPADTMIFDIDWQGIGGMGNLDWNKESFPDAVKFNAGMEEHGFKTMVIIEPFVWANTKNYMPARGKKLVAKDPKGRPYAFQLWGRSALLFDFCNPDAQKFWGGIVKDLHATGIDGWWTDLDEPDVDFPDLVFYGKTTYNLCHNIQANLMSKSIADSYRVNFPNERAFIFSRSGSAGIAKYGTAVWSGDLTSSFQHLKNQIAVGLSAGLSGLPVWGTDMGGFNGHPTPEMMVRWFQFGLLNPIFRAHGNHDPREPWAYGPEAEKIMTDTINLRYRLLPHLYTVLYQMHVTGLPPMRPLFLEFPDDKDSWAETGEYMFGESLLSAPVVDEGTNEKRVYFPPGKWYDFRSDKIFMGPGAVKYPAPLDVLPLFVRGGSVIAMEPVMQYTGQRTFDSTELHIYPSEKKFDYELYEDDGNTNEYMGGKFALTKVTVEPGADRLTVTVNPAEGAFAGLPVRKTWQIIVHGLGKEVAGVRLDGKKITKPPVVPDSAHWDIGKNRAITVTVPMSSAGFKIEIEE